MVHQTHVGFAEKRLARYARQTNNTNARPYITHVGNDVVVSSTCGGGRSAVGTGPFFFLCRSFLSDMWMVVGEKRSGHAPEQEFSTLTCSDQ